MDGQIEKLIANLKKRNISGFYCIDKDQANRKILEIIPGQASIGFSGSVSLDQLGIIKQLGSRGNKIFNPYKEGVSKEEGLELRRQGANADVYLASANAISESGELVFFSGFGNRTSGISYAKNVIIVCGINKITVDLSQALIRAREYATPLNCKRLNWNSACFPGGVCREEICFAPEYKRMCCQTLIIESEVVPDRLKVVLINENLGF